MDHGVTAASSLQVSRRAAFERKLSSHSIANVEDMIEGYKQELSDYKHRLEVIEQGEVKKVVKELEHREELANNHGKPKNYFLTPSLATRARSNSRRFRRLSA